MRGRLPLTVVVLGLLSGGITGCVPGEEAERTGAFTFELGSLGKYTTRLVAPGTLLRIGGDLTGWSVTANPLDRPDESLLSTGSGDGPTERVWLVPPACPGGEADHRESYRVEGTSLRVTLEVEGCAAEELPAPPRFTAGTATVRWGPDEAERRR